MMLERKLSRRQALVMGSGLVMAAIWHPSLAKATRKIIVQGGSPSANVGYMPIFVAQELGFFKEEGLAVDVRFSRGAPLAAQIISTGDADIGNFTYGPLIFGYSKGLRGKFYYQFYNKTIYFIGVPAAGNIKTVKDLFGKKLGVSSMSSSAIPIAKSILRESGVSPDDVEFVPVGVGAQVMAALDSSKIDAIAQWDAAFGGLESIGAKLRYFHNSKLRDIGNGGYFASESMLQNRGDDLVAYGRACAKATAFCFANRKAAVQLYWKRNPAGKHGRDNEEAMKNSLNEIKYVMEDIKPISYSEGRPIFGKIDMNKIENYINIFAKEAQIKSPPRAGDIAVAGYDDAINKFDLAKIKAMAKKWR